MAFPGSHMVLQRQINLERQSLIARRGELDQQLESLVVRKTDAKHEYDKGAAEYVETLLMGAYQADI